MNKLRREHDAALDHRRRELDQVKKKLSQMVDAIADGAPVAPIKDKMHELENRRVELETLLQEVQEAPPLLHPNMAYKFRDEVENLVETLTAPEHSAEANEVLRSLVEKIVMTPDESENRLVADLHGDLAGILGLAAKSAPCPQIDGTMLRNHLDALGGSQTHESAPEGASQVKLVAGAGFEPATFRL